MPRGNVKTWLFSDPTLVPSVLTDGDFLRNGYVWGQNGGLHYCFVDPRRYVLEVWEKEEQLRKFAWLLPNLAAAALALWLGGPAAAIITFVSVPTLPLVLWYFYRASAEDQPGPVATNGPQMEYPLNQSLAGLVTMGAAAGAVAGFLQQLAVAMATEAAGGIVVGGVLVTSTVLTSLVAAVGTGTNVFAIAIYILGKMSKPFDRVDGNGIQDPGVGIFNWGFMCRGTPAFPTYQIGQGRAPSGRPVCSGGLVPMIINRAVVYGNVGWPIAVWAFIPLTPAGGVIDETQSGSHPEIEPLKPERALILVAGSPTWSPVETAQLANLHGATFAICTDGNQSPVLGSTGELVMECHSFLDCVQRYGLKMVPLPANP